MRLALVTTYYVHSTCLIARFVSNEDMRFIIILLFIPFALAQETAQEAFERYRKYHNDRNYIELYKMYSPDTQTFYEKILHLARTATKEELDKLDIVAQMAIVKLRCTAYKDTIRSMTATSYLEHSYKIGYTPELIEFEKKVKYSLVHIDNNTKQITFSLEGLPKPTEAQRLLLIDGKWKIEEFWNMDERIKTLEELDKKNGWKGVKGIVDFNKSIQEWNKSPGEFTLERAYEAAGHAEGAAKYENKWAMRHEVEKAQKLKQQLRDTFMSDGELSNEEQTAIKALDVKIAALEQNLSQSKQKQEQAEKIAKLQKMRSELKATFMEDGELAEHEKIALGALDKQIKAVTQSTATKPTTNKSPTPATTKDVQQGDGKVTSFTHGEKSVVNINIGSKQGLRVGDKILISKNGDNICKATITRVAEKKAIAEIKSSDWEEGVEQKVESGNTVEIVVTK